MDKFQGKYRIPSARASWWNYGDHAGYFITIVTHHRKHYFGEIEWDNGPLNGPPTSPRHVFIPTPIGQTVASEWLKTVSLRPDMNLTLDEWVVMPNHFHAILWIGNNVYNRDTIVETPGMASLRRANAFGPQSKNLASVLRGFKSAVTAQALDHHLEFGWQERYYDHIIRTEASYRNIQHYIIQNVQNWHTDRFYQ